MDRIVDLRPIGFEEGLERIGSVDSGLSQEIARASDRGLRNRPVFFEASYAYGESILRQGKWVFDGLPSELDYGTMPLGLILRNEVEINYHYRRDPRFPPSTRGREKAGSLIGVFEILDFTAQKFGWVQPEERPLYEAWNLTAGCVGFRFFSCRKPYRQKLTALLPTTEPSELADEAWPLNSIRQRGRHEPKGPFILRGSEPPESRYLQLLSHCLCNSNSWKAEVLYFGKSVFERILEDTSFVRRLSAAGWVQSREKRAFADVALQLGPILSDCVSQAGSVLASHLYQVLFDFLLLSRGVGMGYRPVLTEESLNTFEEIAPFRVYEHFELANLRRPVLLIPSRLDTGQTLLLPLDQATAHGMVTPKISWKREIFEPTVQIIGSLIEAGVIDPRKTEIACAHLPKKGDLTIEQFGGSNDQLGWLKDVELDRHGRTFLAIRLLNGRGDRQVNDPKPKVKKENRKKRNPKSSS